MHILTVLCFIAVINIGLLPRRTLGYPIITRAYSLYSTYQSDNSATLDLRPLDTQSLSSQMNPKVSSPAFSNAAKVGFVNVMLRTYKHTASPLRYFKTPEIEHLSTSLAHPVGLGPFDLAIHGLSSISEQIHAKLELNNEREQRSTLNDLESLEQNLEASTVYLPDPNHRRCWVGLVSRSLGLTDAKVSQSGSTSTASVRAPDYRRNTKLKRSSTHAAAGEHLKVRM
ncbi:hypothetical protein RHS03_05019, partial [Rhizoctonia solani]